MPRSLVALALVAVMLVAAPIAVAQDASPAASPEAMEGITLEHLGNLVLGPGVVLPVVRVELAPGASIPPHSSPGPALAHVESGQVSYITIEGVARRATVTVLVPAGTPMAGTPAMGTPAAGMADAMGTPAADATPGAGLLESIAVVEEEVLVLGEEIPLSAGDAVVYSPDAVHSFTNTGAEPAVLLIIGELPPGQQPFQVAGEEAGTTPEASPAA